MFDSQGISSMVEDPKVVLKMVWILDSTRVICSTWREERGHLHPSYKLIYHLVI